MSGARPDSEAIIIGYGFEYLVMALNCARSIRESNPGLPTTLVTNVSVDAGVLGEWFDRVIVRDEPSDRNRLVKTSILEHAVAERILYIDADSEVVGDLNPAFRLLDRFDVAIKAHATPVNKPFELADAIPGGVFPHVGGGFLVLKAGEASRNFLAHWQRRMLESGLARDQPALARTVYDLPEARLVLLNAVWCADEWEAANLFNEKREQPRIRHYARPHLNQTVARRLRETLQALMPLLPRELAIDPAVVRVTEKYRRITHPLFASPLTRRLYLSVAHRWGRLRGRPTVSVIDRDSQVHGRPYTRDNGRLWAD